jgi:EAL domain-containing protein (putative c-di-GMP-specific phosphodiesterase class I)
LKTPRNPQRFPCTLEVAVNQKNEFDDTGDAVIHIATPSGQNLMSLSISCEISRHFTAALARATLSIDIDGSVTVILDDDVEQAIQKATVALDQLVSEAIAPEMLEDEPDAALMLAKFRDRLLKSLEQVGQAIASLPKD